MKVVIMKVLIALAIAMAFTIAILTNMQSVEKQASIQEDKISIQVPQLKKRVSRFLVEQKEKNPRAADHCHKDNEICYVLEGKNSTCCNNKCMDLGYDKHNCGACKKKCKFTETCCRGQCVNLAYDKRHCGFCNHRCMPGGYCFYGMCDYA